MSSESEEDRAVSATRNRLMELGYLNPERVLEDAINLLTRYHSLELLSASIERKGRKDELIKLSGKFTITPPTDQFEIFGTITIWVEKNFPKESPNITFTQTNIPTSYFEPFLNVKQGTVIFSPYHRWDEHQSTLLELIQCVTLNLRQVCLGWVLSARDQEENNYAIPPRLSLPTGFPPVPISNSNKPFEPAPIGARPAFLNANPLPPNSIQPPHQMYPRPRQPLLPNPAAPFQHPNEPHPFRLPPPTLPYQNFPPLIRQTSTSHQQHPEIRNSYISVVGPTGFYPPPPPPQPLTTPPQPPPLKSQTSPSQGQQLSNVEVASSPPKMAPKITEVGTPQNGVFPHSPSSPNQANQTPDLSSPAPTVPMTARKVKNT